MSLETPLNALKPPTMVGGVNGKPPVGAAGMVGRDVAEE
jgi:hypothetical protein